MTSKADFKKQWESETPEERRVRLNFLASIEEKSDDQQREHDMLAEMVAEDEDNAARARTAPEPEA